MGATGRGVYFDGETARGAEVDWRVEGDRLALREQGVTRRVWDLVALRRIRDGGAALRLGPGSESDEALLVADLEAAANLAAACPALERPAQSGWAVARRVLPRAALAVAAAALMLVVIIPGLAERLAPLAPISAQQAMGEATVNQLARFTAEGFCEAPEGVAALARLERRLTKAARPRLPLTIRVADSSMVNALTAPGGHILIFRGLLDQAAGPDEVAGVLAHEIGHVEGHDTLRQALRAAGSAGVISVLIGDVAGGAVAAALAEQALNANYSQQAERDADAFAARMLASAGIAPEGFRAFFRKLLRKHGEASALERYFASHPPSRGRLEALEAAPEPARPSPALQPEDWAALKAICAD